MAQNFPFRLLSIAGLLLALLALPQRSQSLSTPPVPRGQRHEYRHEIDAMEEAWRTAILKANASGLDALLSDDYTGITAKGAIQTKDQAVSSVKSGSLQLSALTFADRKVRIYGSTAVVTSIAELTGGKNDPSVTGRYRYTRIYVRNQAGQWKIVSFEASRIQDSNDHK